MRKAFREAFEVLLESQDKSTKTQDLMLDELRALNRRIEEAPNEPPQRYGDRFQRGDDGQILLYTPSSCE